MEEYFAALSKAYTDYRQDIEAFERKSKPTDGLFGFGRSLQNDACNDRFDQRVEEAVSAIAAVKPAAECAERVIRTLLIRDDLRTWPLPAQWMLQAAERHALQLIPFLSSEAAAALHKEYADRYRPWERLPVQKQLLQALKKAHNG